MSAGWALCWETWARQRWVVLTCAAYFAVVIVLGQELPREIWATIGGLEVIPLILTLPVILASVCRGFDGRAEAAGSMFPERILVLPISSRALVGWSMLTGAVPLALCWPLCALALRWPLARVPLLWPGLLVFNVVAWLQVLCWMPFRVPYLRLWAAGLWVPGLIWGTVYLRERMGVSEPTVVSLLCGFGLVAFAVGVAAVRCARHGDGIGLEEALKEFVTGFAGLERARQGMDTVEGSRQLPESVPLVERGPFRSSAQALLWFDWRVYRSPLLWLTCFGLVFGLPLPFLILSGLEQSLGKAAGLGLGLAIMLGVVWTPLGLVHSERRGSGRLFLLVQPVSTASLVAAKLQLCALWALLSVLLFVTCGFGWGLATGRWVEMSDRLLAVSGSGWAAVLVLAGGVLALSVLIWGHVVAWLWVGLSGRHWLEWIASLTWVVVLLGGGLLFQCVAMLPDFRARVGPRLPAILAGVLVLKVLLTIAVFRANLKQRLLSGRTVVLALLAWVTFAGSLFAGLAWLIPVEIVGRVPLAEGVALAVPIARIGLAPLALAWNRHR